MKHYTLATGVRLTPAVEKKVAQIATSYRALTGNKIQVNSGTRSPAKQAKAMFMNMKKGDRLKIYRNQTLAGQIRNAFDAARVAGKSDQATTVVMEQIISQQVARGRYISKHLISGAVDIDVKGISSSTQKAAFKSIAMKIAKKVIYETARPHWHLQF